MHMSCKIETKRIISMRSRWSDESRLGFWPRRCFFFLNFNRVLAPRSVLTAATCLPWPFLLLEFFSESQESHSEPGWSQPPRFSGASAIWVSGAPWPRFVCSRCSLRSRFGYSQAVLRGSTRRLTSRSAGQYFIRSQHWRALFFHSRPGLERYGNVSHKFFGRSALQ